MHKNNNNNNELCILYKFVNLTFYFMQAGSSIRIEEKKRKAVFKAVLDSPFNINWLVLRETLFMK